MRPYLIRVLRALLDLFDSPRTPQRAVLEVALELQRLDHRLFEICDGLSLPIDVGKMREDRVPRTVAAELNGIVEMVKADYLDGAVASLLRVAQVTERVHGTRRRASPRLKHHRRESRTPACGCRDRSLARPK